MSLSEELKRASDRAKHRFHTPGHKGELLRLDITEMSDGSFPDRFADDAEKRIAAFYGTRHARMLCCGSSQGVKAAIFWAACDGIAAVHSHRAVFDGFWLAGMACSAIGTRGVMPLTLDQIKRALKPSDGAVVVTSPTYYGYCADIDGIRGFCRSRGLKFLVDGAHGAHFGSSPLLPPSFADKCDVCNVSAHKTLCALTQSAILLDNLDGADAERLREATDVMGTTSPSYPLYASIDGAVEKQASAHARYAELYEPTAALRAEFPFLKNDDFTRLVLDCEALGADAEKLNGALCRRGVFSEMTDGRRIVFILTAQDDKTAVSALTDALRAAVSETT